MPALVTNQFRIHNAKQFVESISEAAAVGGTTVTSTAAGSTTSLDTNYYLFIGRSTNWSTTKTYHGTTEGGGTATDVAPPTPTDTTQNTEYLHWRDMLSAKKVTSSDVKHLMPRVNWTTGRYYQEYKDSVNNSVLLANTTGNDSAGTSRTWEPMYVVTSAFNVYKVMSNNGNVASTVEPSSVDTSQGVTQTTSDGYKWKYLYTISASEALKFVTSAYVPVKQMRDANSYGQGSTTGMPTDDGSNQYDIEVASVSGALDIFEVTGTQSGYGFVNNLGIGNVSSTNTSHIKLADTASSADDYYNNTSIYFSNGQFRKITDYTGSTRVGTLDTALPAQPANTGYGHTANIAPYVTIRGDGDGNARAVATQNSTDTDAIGAVLVVNVGASYTTSNTAVEIYSGGLSSSGTGATVTPIISPKGGHGYDPVAELGGYFVMVNVKLEQSESGDFTTGNDFRKIGLLKNPNANTTHPYTAATALQALTVTYTGQTSTNMAADTIITGGTSGATAVIVDVTTGSPSTTGTFHAIGHVPGTSASNGFNSKPGSLVATETVTWTSPGSGTATLTAITAGEMEPMTGEIIYIENRAPVTRASDQTEDIKLIIEF